MLEARFIPFPTFWAAAIPLFTLRKPWPQNGITLVYHAVRGKGILGVGRLGAEGWRFI
jgi:hypothetical protein